MRIDCPHCQEKALINSTNALSPTVKDLYCSCTNTPECGATFVYKLGYSHDLNPPIKTTQQLAATLLKSLPINERQALVAQMDLFS